MPERTDRAMEVLADLLEAPEAERPALLERTCAGDEALRDEVAGLLRLGRRASDFLLRVDPAREEPFQSLPHGGTSFGKYRTLRLVGEGGMGSVYEAEQDHPRRRVALKVIKPGMDSRQVIRRFEAERQALALMDHPNIAKVFDAGLDDRGRPFFAMELVEGVPLTEYCDAGALDMRQRLELFAAVCRAVQHAHQRAVIHRDLKPTNVLVAVVDGRPVPKVIDFGIAKAVGEGRLTEQTLVTECRELVGTPEYMSPEQAAGGGDVDTRSDIYSLGVLLYELLTGTTPFDRGQARDSGPEELRRLIREAEPPKPSTRLTQRQRQSGAGASGGGGGEKAPPAAARAVRGELDWITMKCLEKDRARRYETASELAADVGRYLSYEPVHAAAPSPWYRFRKFARRNRAPLAAAAAIAVLLVAGITGSTVGMLRARAAQAQLKRESEQAFDLNVFFRDIFLGARPERAGGRKVTVSELLDRAAARLPEHFRGQPEVQMRAHRVLGDSYGLLGDPATALKHASIAYDLARTTYGEDGAPTLEAAAFVANWTMNVASSREELDEAQALAARAYETALRRLGEVHPVTHFAGITAGNTLLDRDTPEAAAAAEPIFRRLIQIQEEHPHVTAIGGTGSTFTAYACLAWALWGQQKLSEAEHYVREALRRNAAEGFSRARSHAILLSRLGGILRDQKNLKDAAEAYQQALALDDELGHRLPTIELAANAYFDILVRLEDYERAIAYARRRVEQAQGDDPKDAALIVARMERLIGLLRRARRAADKPALGAELETALDGLVRLPAEDRPALLRRADALAELRRFSEAAANYDRCIELDPGQEDAWTKRGTLLAYVEDRDAFAKHCRRMLDYFKDTTSRPVANRVAKTALLLPQPRDVTDAAVALADRAIDGEKEHEFLRWFRLVKSLAEIRAGRFGDAVVWAEKARRDLPHAPDNPAPEAVAVADLLLSIAHHHLGNDKLAREAFDRAGETIAREWGSDPYARPIGRQVFALLREARGLIGADSAARQDKPNG